MARATEEDRSRPPGSPGTWILVGLVAIWVGGLVGLPLASAVAEACTEGWAGVVAAWTDPQTLRSLLFTLVMSLASLGPSVVFALAASWLLVKFRFPGRSLILALIDLPLSLSPVLVGALVAFLHGSYGWWGPFWDGLGIKILFNWPAIWLTNQFIICPLVVRELMPVLEERGDEEEEAARLLGASPWFTYTRVTLPALRGALLYGSALAFARAAGEYGAANVVLGLIRGWQTTLPIHVDLLYQDFAVTQAFAVALLFVVLALLTLGIKRWVERSTHGT